jgi:hypothetical protein
MREFYTAPIMHDQVFLGLSQTNRKIVTTVQGSHDNIYHGIDLLRYAPPWDNQEFEKEK